MNQAYSFIRWSRPEQGKGDSLRRQKEDSARLCKEKGWNLTELPPLAGRSAFKGKQRTVGPLAEFVKMAEAGKVPKGSVLIVESLDRLTREAVRTAVKFFLSILDCGISIATTSPVYIFNHDTSNDFGDIMFAVGVLSRGHEESAIKSERIGKAWAKKRATAGTAKMTSTCPAWLKLDKDSGKFVEIKKRADVVRKIFELACDGYGVFRITRKLNTDKVPPIGSKPKRLAKQWYESYVIRILNNRATIGEFQPCKRADGKSIPQGDPIKGYYPSVVSDADFVAARRAIDSRALGFKRTGKDIPNIFGKLIKNARDGSGWLYIPPKKKSPIARLEPVGGRQGVSLPLSCRYQPLEAAFIKFLGEITAADLTGKVKVSKATEIELKVKDLTKRIGVLEARMDTDPDLGSLLDKLAKWKAERKQLEADLEAEQNPTDEGAILADAQGIIELMATDPEHYRTKLKQLIHLIVTEAWLLVFEYRTKGSRGRDITARGAILQVHFKAGHYRSIFFTTDKRETASSDNRHILKDLRQYREKPWDAEVVATEKLKTARKGTADANAALCKLDAAIRSRRITGDDLGREVNSVLRDINKCLEELKGE